MANEVSTRDSEQQDDARLPGTVTLMFTDIVGSTRMLRGSRASYAEVLAVHRRLLRAAFADHSGREIDTQGDSFFVAFPTAGQAVAAAAQAQRSLATHDWPDGIRVLVRMGLHTGEATLAGGSYIGLAVHRAARIAAAAAGGQVVLSDVTAALVDEDLPAGSALRPLGEHRLKDFPRPAALFQLDVVGLPTAFPPLRTAREDQLPASVDNLLGRDADVAALASLLGDERTRLVTVTGPGGIGKTRVAVESARAVAGRFPGGVVFVPLSSVTDARLVSGTIADALGAGREPGGDPVQAIRLALGKDRTLLLLDNFEQVLAAAGELAALLDGSPGAVALVTSRRALRLRSEHRYPLAPLDLDAAERLFVERAAAVHPGFRLDSTNSTAVTEICRRLDGLPLAIELAAARVDLLPPTAMAARLGQRLDVLGAGPVDFPARQRTLRATMEWSFGLLGRYEQALFTRLAAFSGGWTMAAAETVCGRPDEPEVLDTLGVLLDASLIVADGGSATEPRMRMLDTVRSYAVEQLAAAPDRTETERRHTTWMLDTTRAYWHNGADGFRQSLERFDRERANLRAAVHRGLEAADARTVHHLVRDSFPYLLRRDALPEAADWLDRSLARAAAPSAERGRLLVQRAVFAGFLGDASDVRPLLEEGRPLLPDDPAGPDHGWDLVVAGMAGTYAALAEGSIEEAARCVDAATEGFAAVGQEIGLGVTAMIRGNLALLRGDPQAAETQYRFALGIAGRLRDDTLAGDVLSLLGLVLLERGDVSGGRRSVLDGATEALRPDGNPTTMAHALEGLAAVALAHGRPAVSARALSALTEARKNAPMALWPVITSLAADLAGQSKEQLGQQNYAAAWEEGREWPLVRALNRTLEDLVDTDEPANTSPHPPDDEAGPPAAARS